MALAKCNSPGGCQYNADQKRNDGLCEWHGQLDAYQKTGNRDALFNRGMCGEDAVGPRIGQLCTIGKHHDECEVGRSLKASAAAKEAVLGRRLTPHQQALGLGGDEA